MTKVKREIKITDRDCFWFSYAFCRSFCNQTKSSCIAYCPIQTLNTDTMNSFTIGDILYFKKGKKK